MIRARAERLLVLDDAGIAAHLHRPLGVPEEIGIVALLPDEHEMGGRHVARDERATRSGARERIGADAVPAEIVVGAVVLPELLVLDHVLALEQQ